MFATAKYHKKVDLSSADFVSHFDYLYIETGGAIVIQDHGSREETFQVPSNFWYWGSGEKIVKTGTDASGIFAYRFLQDFS